MMTNGTRYALEKKLWQDTVKNHLFLEDMCIVSANWGFPDPHTDVEEDGYKLLWSITWGDWKHDHLWSEIFLKEWLENNGYTPIYHVDNITEDDGSDTYSADHCILFVKK